VKLSAAVVLIAACHHAQQPTAPVATRDAAPSVYEELEAKMKPVFAAIATLEPTIAAHDCAKLATQLRQFGADHGAELGDAEQLRDKLGPDERDQFEKAHEADVARMAQTIDAALHACPGDKAVESALDVSGFARK
jgi:N-acyl-D-aspartate/D-glutamate deacylase